MITIRVYGLLHREGHLLFSSEQVLKQQALKFPGGGLEHGEGTLDALKREFQEELNWEINVKGHIYTTDFYVPSFLSPADQVVSIYYEIDVDRPFNVPEPIPGFDEGQHFVWMDWKKTPPETLSFPIDQEVIRRLQQGNLQLISR
jgi:8-oxo-dGTP pyrophosphatase MutT (NUDIX family)